MAGANAEEQGAQTWRAGAGAGQGQGSWVWSMIKKGMVEGEMERPVWMVFLLSSLLDVISFGLSLGAQSRRNTVYILSPSIHLNHNVQIHPWMPLLLLLLSSFMNVVCIPSSSSSSFPFLPGYLQNAHFRPIELYDFCLHPIVHLHLPSICMYLCVARRRRVNQHSFKCLPTLCPQFAYNIWCIMTIHPSSQPCVCFCSL